MRRSQKKGVGSLILTPFSPNFCLLARRMIKDPLKELLPVPFSFLAFRRWRVTHGSRTTFHAERLKFRAVGLHVHCDKGSATFDRGNFPGRSRLGLGPPVLKKPPEIVIPTGAGFRAAPSHVSIFIVVCVDLSEKMFDRLLFRAVVEKEIRNYRQDDRSEYSQNKELDNTIAAVFAGSVIL